LVDKVAVPPSAVEVGIGGTADAANVGETGDVGGVGTAA
jgi:hypothetical protein